FVSKQIIFKVGDGASRFPLLNFFASPIAEVAHSFSVGPSPVSLALDQRWAVAAPRALRRHLRGLLYGQHVVSVHFDTGPPIRCATLSHIGIAGGISKRHLR